MSELFNESHLYITFYTELIWKILGKESDRMSGSNTNRTSVRYTRRRELSEIRVNKETVKTTVEFSFPSGLRDDNV